MLHHGGMVAASAAQRASCSDAFAAFSQSIESIKNRVLPETALPPPATRSWCAGHRPRWRLFQVCSKVVRVMGIFTTGTGTCSIHIYCHKEHEMRVTSYSNKTQSMKKRSLITTAAALCASALTAIPSTNAFAPQPSVMGAPSSSTQLAARNGVPIHEDSAESSRRDVLKSSLGGLFAGLTLATNIDVQPASASYSAYTNREKDWDERKKSGGMSSSNDYEST